MRLGAFTEANYQAGAELLNAFQAVGEASTPLPAGAVTPSTGDTLQLVTHPTDQLVAARLESLLQLYRGNWAAITPLYPQIEGVEINEVERWGGVTHDLGSRTLPHVIGKLENMTITDGLELVLPSAPWAWLQHVIPSLRHASVQPLGPQWQPLVRLAVSDHKASRIGQR